MGEVVNLDEHRRAKLAKARREGLTRGEIIESLASEVGLTVRHSVGGMFVFRNTPAAEKAILSHVTSTNSDHKPKGAA